MLDSQLIAVKPVSTMEAEETKAPPAAAARADFAAAGKVPAAAMIAKARLVAVFGGRIAGADSRSIDSSEILSPERAFLIRYLTVDG